MQVFSYDYIDDSRILLADIWGRLALLSLSRCQSGVSELKCALLGEVSSFNNVFTVYLGIFLNIQISSAASIVYLNNGIFYVGSHHGDCQLARLSPTPLRVPNGTLSHVQILDVYKNVAPIGDALITESEGSIQARIIIPVPRNLVLTWLVHL
jgi:DNA damage-binding protein 1